MAYPPPAQRPPPLRQYASPAPGASPGGYAPDPYGPDGGYGAPNDGYVDAGFEDQGYGHGGAPPGPPMPQPRSMRPPGSSGGRPPPGYDPRRGPPPRGMKPPSGSRSRGGENYDNPFPSVPPGRDPRDPRGPRDPRDPRDPRSRGRDPRDPRDPRAPRAPGDPRSRRGPPAGIESGMAAMDINGRGPPRPHTSNSSRRPDPRDPRGPPRGVPPGRGRPPPGYGPPRSGRPPNGMPPPGRSNTMPMNDPYGPPADYDYPGGPMMGDMPPRPSTAGGARPRGPPDLDPGLMIPPPDPMHRVSYAPKDFLDSYFHGGEEHEMPNFDAIPESGPVDEMGLTTPTGPQTPTSPGSPAGPYAPHDAGTPRSQGSSKLREGANQFENAGFQFDLPGDSPGAHSHGGPGAIQGAYAPMGYEEPGSYFPNGGNPYPQPGQSPMASPEENPDALPQHPAPYRPGPPAAKPAPVRQYNGGGTPVAGPAVGPQTMPPDGLPAGRVPVTHEELTMLQQKAKNNPSDPAAQLMLAKKFAEAATVLVNDNSRLDPKTKARAKEKYIMDAHKIVKKLVSSGYPDAQFFLADCYGEGMLGLEMDPKEAYSLYHSAAKAGHPQSAYRVAVCCEIGQEEGGGTKRDPLKAIEWYKKAASFGDTPAMYKMGMINLKGLLGQPKNPREGVTWLKRAAERADEENPHALHELALMYETAQPNDAIVRDEAYASQLFHQAADLGYKFSQFRLGTAYEYGMMGCPVDNRMSIIWYTRAAAQGEHQSELALSGWYLTGSDGTLQQNDTEAYLWARKAATAGLAKAEYAMGYFTEVGIGIQANLDDAKRWYWRAAAQGNPKARERLEELKKGGGRMQKSSMDRAKFNGKQADGECVLM